MRAQRPKRVLLSTDAVGGVWVYTLELAAALKPAYEFEFAVLGPAPSPQQLQCARAAGARIHVSNLPLDWTAQQPETLADASRELAALARRRRVDLVQLHTPALLGDVNWPAPVLAVLHSCVATWWHAMHGELAPPNDFVWRMNAVQAGLQHADRIVAPSHALAEAAQTIYRMQRPIQTVYNSRRPSADAQPAPEGCGVLAAGRLWDAAKNIAVLEQAAGLMNGVPVSAAGPITGPNGACLTLHTIRHLGALPPDHLHAAMRSARIFASPALYEPFGLAVLEAAQAGLPLVLADIPAFRELWDGAALFLNPEDPGLWAASLTALHARPDECRARGAQARAHAGRYGTEHFAQAMRGIYQELLAAPTCGPASPDAVALNDAPHANAA